MKVFREGRFLAPALSAAAFMLAAATASAGTMYNFQTLDNSGDPAFNQLLGINNAGEIVGYFGDGTLQPNKGYTLAPPYGPANYTNENFPGSAQTQVVGINNNSSPMTVGFYIDAQGNNFGFKNQGGTFASVTGPDVPAMGTTVTQLLGVNKFDIAVGFDTDGANNNHGIVSNTTGTSSEPPLPASFHAVSVTFSGVSDNGDASGFYTDTAGNTHGFVCAPFCKSYDDPYGTDTMFLGVNDNSQAVGSFVENDETQGLLFNFATDTFQTISDPLSSATAAFGVTGTTVNGINDKGQLVGFYSDGTNVNGFLADPVPEPAPVALLGVGLIGLFLYRRNRRYSPLNNQNPDR